MPFVQNHFSTLTCLLLNVRNFNNFFEYLNFINKNLDKHFFNAVKGFVAYPCSQKVKAFTYTLVCEKKNDAARTSDNKSHYFTVIGHEMPLTRKNEQNTVSLNPQNRVLTEKLKTNNENKKNYY